MLEPNTSTLHFIHIFIRNLFWTESKWALVQISNNQNTHSKLLTSHTLKDSARLQYHGWSNCAEFKTCMQLGANKILNYASRSLASWCHTLSRTWRLPLDMGNHTHHKTLQGCLAETQKFATKSRKLINNNWFFYYTLIKQQLVADMWWQ